VRDADPSVRKVAASKEHSNRYILNKASYIFLQMVVTDENRSNAEGI
jgi:hypothetical protein